jgi:hypothetical protein
MRGRLGFNISRELSNSWDTTQSRSRKHCTIKVGANFNHELLPAVPLAKFVHSLGQD